MLLIFKKLSRERTAMNNIAPYQRRQRGANTLKETRKWLYEVPNNGKCWLHQHHNSHFFLKLNFAITLHALTLIFWCLCLIFIRLEFIRGPSASRARLQTEDWHYQFWLENSRKKIRNQPHHVDADKPKEWQAEKNQPWIYLERA